MSRYSAGLLPYRVGTGGLHVLLVHPGGPWWARRDAGSWSIPKGEFHGDEDPKDAAMREFREETGFAVPRAPLVELGRVRQRGGKVVLAWAIEGDFDPEALHSNLFEMEWPPKSGTTRRFPEIDRAEWCDLALAGVKIHPAQAEFLERLAEVLRERGRIGPAGQRPR